MTRLILLLSVAIFAAIANPVGPSYFHIVSVFFSDNGALLYYRVLDVSQDGDGSVIRYSRIAPRSLSCNRMIVQTVIGRVDDVTPAQLAENNNPCAINPSALKAAIEHYSRRAGILEAISFSVAARCDGASVLLALPMFDSLDLKPMHSAHPEMIRLWDLASELATRAFGPKDPFQDKSDPEDLALQSEGAKLVPELMSGRYDAALTAALHGIFPGPGSTSFRELLKDYSGSVKKENNVPQLLNAERYHFSDFSAPRYPPLGIQARIEGTVELRLKIDKATGEVLNVKLVSGHPLLKDSAIRAAERWRFVPNSVFSPTVNIVLRFTLQCP